MQHDTATTVRKPRYAYFEARPSGGIYLTQWAIERQLSLASDYGDQELVDVLRALNPDLDESIAADIEKLLDLGDEIADYSTIPDLEIDPRPILVDDYAEHLHRLARLVRGLPVTPTRPRHTLSSTR